VALLFLFIKNPCLSDLLSVTKKSSVLWSSDHYVCVHVLCILMASLSVVPPGLLPDAVSWDEGTRRCCWIWICLSVCQRIRYVFHHPVFPFPRNKNVTWNPPCFFRYQAVQYQETGSIRPAFSTFSWCIGCLLLCLLARQDVSWSFHQLQ
jgi:hypothetical protein